jgi:hypothetical protein
VAPAARTHYRCAPFPAVSVCGIWSDARIALLSSTFTRPMMSAALCRRRSATCIYSAVSLLARSGQHGRKYNRVGWQSFNPLSPLQRPFLQQIKPGWGPTGGNATFALQSVI